MVDFIYLGLLELRETRCKRELQNEKLLPTVQFEPTIFRLRSGQAINCLMRSDNNKQLKVIRTLPVLFILTCVVDLADCFVV